MATRHGDEIICELLTTLGYADDPILTAAEIENCVNRPHRDVIEALASAESEDLVATKLIDGERVWWRPDE